MGLNIRRVAEALEIVPRSRPVETHRCNTIRLLVDLADRYAADGEIDKLPEVFAMINDKLDLLQEELTDGD